MTAKHLKMYLSVYEGKLRVGYIFLRREGNGVKSKYIANVQQSLIGASQFTDQTLPRGLTIAQRCFPGQLIDIEIY